MSESDEETRSPRILLVVTGDLEELAFKPALEKVFPTAYFETRRVSGLTSQGSLVASDSRPGGAKAYPIVNELLGAPLPRYPAFPEISASITPLRSTMSSLSTTPRGLSIRTPGSPRSSPTSPGASISG